MGIFGDKPWWKDEKDGWPCRGVRDFFDESKKHYMKGDTATAIEVLEWGRRFSREFGSGGGARRFDEMIQKLRQGG